MGFRCNLTVTAYILYCTTVTVFIVHINENQTGKAFTGKNYNEIYRYNRSDISWSPFCVPADVAEMKYKISECSCSR